MSRIITLLVIFAIGAMPEAAASEDESADSALAWMLGCQGCHGADGRALGDEVPALKNTVARFLSVPGGREYLVQVPGVAMSPLEDEAIAQLTNWMLTTMDSQHLPTGFRKYSAKEVGSLRKNPLGYDAADVRAHLIGKNMALFSN